MTLGELVKNGELKPCNGIADADREVTGAICCDLLSFVMAKGQAGMAWVTVQTHMNVVAVATLHEFSCIILSDGCQMPEDALKKAEAEGIAVLGSKLTGYQVCCLLHGAGIGG
jgi:serine kinase of HPr protein (carbohydrate metabolism regulator)